MREPRSATVGRIVLDALRHSGLTEQSYAASVVELYHRRVALHERSVPFHAGTTAEQLAEAQRANAQILRRMFAGAVRLPADMEEAVVLALPQPYQRHCLAELAARYGLLAVPEPTIDPLQQHATLADLCREFAEAVERVAPMLSDGRIDAGDRHLAGPAIRELRDVLAATHGLIALIESATRPTAPVAQMRRA
jgi:hypothetical protein